MESRRIVVFEGFSFLEIFFFFEDSLLMCMVWICRKNVLSTPASRNIESTQRRRQWRILSRITMERRSAAWRIIGGG